MIEQCWNYLQFPAFASKTAYQTLKHLINFDIESNHVLVKRVKPFQFSFIFEQNLINPTVKKSICRNVSNKYWDSQFSDFNFRAQTKTPKTGDDTKPKTKAIISKEELEKI